MSARGAVGEDVRVWAGEVEASIGAGDSGGTDNGSADDEAAAEDGFGAAAGDRPVPQAVAMPRSAPATDSAVTLDTEHFLIMERGIGSV
ncbi:hypothetical protein ACIRVF_31405 [Kitasatospora sp. NPDC101157]|uniref:hypothetical protein n=1 Tax=Kitasatospora sp. NPDC101157 TaxID=3364098 RepID=UPI00381DE701